MGLAEERDQSLGELVACRVEQVRAVVAVRQDDPMLVDARDSHEQVSHRLHIDVRVPVAVDDKRGRRDLRKQRSPR